MIQKKLDTKKLVRIELCIDLWTSSVLNFINNWNTAACFYTVLIIFNLIWNHLISLFFLSFPHYFCLLIILITLGLKFIKLPTTYSQSACVCFLMTSVSTSTNALTHSLDTFKFQTWQSYWSTSPFIPYITKSVVNPCPGYPESYVHFRSHLWQGLGHLSLNMG